MMKAKPPQAGVTLISLFYGLGVVVLIGVLFTGPDQTAAQIARVHGFPDLAAHPVPLLLGVIGIGVAVIIGLSGMTRWGYWLTLSYAAYLLVVPSLVLRGDASLWANFIWPLIVVGYLLLVRRRYFDAAGSHNNGIQTDNAARCR
jgi:hypothetical protein